MMASFSCILVFILVGFSVGISFDVVDSESYCFKVQGNQTDLIRISYTVSGKGEDQCRIQFFSPDNYIIKDESTKRHGFITHEVQNPGTYKICFSRMDKNTKMVSVDIDKIKRNVNEAEKANDKDVEVMLRKLSSMKNELTRVSDNIRQMQQRKISHFNMNKSSRKGVRWFTFLKILVIVIVGFLQTWIIVKLFNKTQRVKLPFTRVDTL